ncbi:aminopeptidase Ey-like [Silurus meridionalis]|uniref:aminopeptidase Ey-like n=1 Tax=Silurus meridionalis TaxID=175797 RepID=UPI001EEB0B39|nr:aminopeptidase Ey-like [Silurus meridionalis]
MSKCHFSTMCIICTVVSVVSVSILIGLWTFQFLLFEDHTRSQTAMSDGEPCLHEDLVSVSYDITLWPRLQPDSEGLFIFTGNSSVVFRCVKETNLILIHANKLNLTTTATLSTLNGSPAPSITSTRFVSNTQDLVFYLSEKLKAGETYKLHTEFLGELADDLGGFYRSEYFVNGVKQSGVISELHPPHACAGFPCLTETNSKPVYRLTLLQAPGPSPSLPSHTPRE